MQRYLISHENQSQGGETQAIDITCDLSKSYNANTTELMVRYYDAFQDSLSSSVNYS